MVTLVIVVGLVFLVLYLLNSKKAKEISPDEDATSDPYADDTHTFKIDEGDDK